MHRSFAFFAKIQLTKGLATFFNVPAVAESVASSFFCGNTFSVKEGFDEFWVFERSHNRALQNLVLQVKRSSLH